MCIELDIYELKLVYIYVIQVSKVFSPEYS